MPDHHAALIHTMVLASAVDDEMTDAELRIIGDIVNHLPVFADYDHKRLAKDLGDCAALLAKEDGLEEALKRIRAALPSKLRETAYALACDVVAAGGDPSQEELRLLELLCDELAVEPLVSAAIERGARARFSRA
jgi:tellurite resistance protein